MKNYLIVMPRIVNRVGDAYQFPLGLPYVSATLKKNNHHVFTLNLNGIKGSVKNILRRHIADNKIDIVLTGGLSFQFWPIYQIVNTVKNINHDIPIIVGGGLITGDPPAAMQALEHADIGVVGEGEETIAELCSCIDKYTDNGLPDYDTLKSIAGLILPHEDKGYTLTAPRQPIEDLDSIPWPDFDGFEIEKTFQSSAGISGLNSKNTIYMLASRSCPFQCSFCFHTVGRKYRQRSVDNFFAELDYYVKKYKIEYVCVEDELISYNSKRIKEFCERMKKYHIRWWTQFRVDMVEPWLIPLLKEAGCDIMSFGLESANDTVLKSMGKHTTVAQIEKTLSAVYKEGMHFEGAFIFGDRAETYQTATSTLDFWEKHPEFRINLNTITVYPGSPLYNHAKNTGVIKDPVKYLKDGCPQINLTQMSNDEFLDIITKCMEYPNRKAIRMDDEKIISLHAASRRVSVAGKCIKCGHTNEWHDIKLFTTNALACEGCGVRYNVFLPRDLYHTFKTNIEKLLQLGDIAIWGINYVSTRLFNEVDVLQHEGIYPVDTSNIKKSMLIGAKRVSLPQTITDRQIPTVIVAIPAFYHVINLEVQYMYPSVKRVIDIADLIVTDNILQE